MTFEKFLPAFKGKPKIRFWKTGQIGFNQAARHRFNLDNYHFMILFFDRENKRIAFLPTNDDQQEGVKKINLLKTGCMISGLGLLNYFKIEPPEYQLELQKEEGLLIAHLEEAAGRL